MINHSGQFERVGGPGFFFPSLAEAAQAVEVDASRLPNAVAITSPLACREAVAMTPVV